MTESRRDEPVPLEAYEALRAGVVGRVTTRDVVLVEGPDAASWLQGQCAQDLAALEAPDSIWSLLLHPGGKVAALVRVTRTGADRFVLDAEQGTGEAVLTRLERFRFRVKATLEATAWPVVELRGPAAASASGRLEIADTLAVDAWSSLGGIDVLRAGVLPEGVEVADDALFELARIEAGLPAWGRELDDDSIPQSLGLVEAAVSLTKGCYTGQELVARLDARGNRVPTVLRGVEIAGEVRAGDELVVAGRVAALRSVAHSPRTRGTVALALVRREVEPNAAGVVRRAGAPGVELAATVRALPLVEPPGVPG